jgi:biopolymer transport protein ExbD
MALKKFRSCSDVGFNMTPMIDCTFQLIIFFILVGQVASDAYAQNIQLIRPVDSQAIPSSVAKFPNKVTVNVVSAAAGEKNPDPTTASALKFYQILTVRYHVGEVDRMIDVIKTLRNEYEKQFGATPLPSAGAGGKEGDDKRMFFLEIRADERVSWQDVAPVIRAGVEAGINKMNITALTARIGD